MMKHAKERIVAAVALVLLASGCSPAKEEKRAFEVPDSLCGTPVPAELLSLVLPAGGARVAAEREDKHGAQYCTVSVDGTSALHAEWSWWGKGKRTTQVAASMRGVKLDEHVSEDGTYTYAAEGGVSRVTCSEPRIPTRKDEMELYAQIYIANDARPDEAAMEKLIQAYAKSVSASPECVRK
ncbi:hypothetical protein ACFZCF_05425 [Streptomyces sp. NPDC007945]|uniref:hypothetical protein n=1 Tax=Streptomyces sp. NPDC007945 TaxID=3364797 RepID=UPI0036EA95E2